MDVVETEHNCIIPKPYECYVLFIVKKYEQIKSGELTAETQISIADKIIFLSLVKELKDKYYRQNIIKEVVEVLQTITKEDIIKITQFEDTVDIKTLIKKIKHTNYTICELLCYIQSIINIYL